MEGVTREEIESCGFKDVGSLWFRKDTVSGNLGYWVEASIRKWKGKELTIRGHRGSEDDVLFRGDVETVEELKVLLKQTNVID